MIKTLAAVESFTGGLFASEIIAKPGASKYFKGSLVAYDSEVKAKIGVDISKGVINKEVARSMALNGKKFFDVDYCVAFTGNAGPEATEGKPVGLVYIAINEKVFEFHFEGDRNKVRTEAVKFAINEIQKLLKLQKL